MYLPRKFIKEMTLGNKMLRFEHARSIKVNLEQYDIRIFGAGLAINLKTGRKIDKVVIDDLLHEQETLETNVSGLLSRAGLWRVKNHSLNLIFEPRSKTGTEKKKKILKSSSILKEDCQAFDLLGNKTEKIA